MLKTHVPTEQNETSSDLLVHCVALHRLVSILFPAAVEPELTKERRAGDDVDLRVRSPFCPLKETGQISTVPNANPRYRASLTSVTLLVLLAPVPPRPAHPHCPVTTRSYSRMKVD
jgi:hypothetical protein